MEIVSRPTEQEVIYLAQSKLAGAIVLASRKPTLFLSSGGSCLKLLQNFPPIKVSYDFTVGVLDERFSTDPTVNNLLQLYETDFFKDLPDSAQVIDSVPREGESFEEFTERYEQGLYQWLADTDYEGQVIVTLGIGSDGHTAGIFPDKERPDEFRRRFFDETVLAVGYNAPQAIGSSQRLTVNFNFLTDQVSQAIVFATGGAKRSVVEQILTGDQDLSVYPAAIIHELEEVTLFTDSGDDGDMDY